MIVMVAANGNKLQHVLAAKFPRSIGWMMSPATGFMRPHEHLPYAIDNGKYGAWKKGEPWNVNVFFNLLDRCHIQKNIPEWVVVPDEVGNREATLRLWDQYKREVKTYGWKLAFAVQDGMTPRDVPEGADVVFVGGTTKWKWRNVALFCATFPRVHVGRVNWWDKLEYCERVGVESVDGSGFFREGPEGRRAQQLIDFVSGHRRSREQLNLVA